VRAASPVPDPVSGRVLIAGDTHGNLRWIAELAELAARHRCDGIVQLGDFGFWPDRIELGRSRNRHRVLDEAWLNAVARALTERGVWMRVIDGNHDAHPLVADRYPSGESGLAPIRSGLLDWATRGARWDWCGVRFGALGGAVSIDRDLRIPGVSWWATEEITPDEVARLGDAPLDVLFTHDAPEGVGHPLVDLGSLGAQYLQVESQSRAGRRLVEQARRATRPVLQVHGHHHLRYRADVGGGGVATTVQGLGCDQHGNGEAWGVLELPGLVFADGWEVARSARTGRPLDPSRVGPGTGRDEAPVAG